MLEQNTHPASLEAWGSRHQTRQRVSGVSGVRVASEPVVAISIVAKSYHGPSEQSSLRSLTPAGWPGHLGWVVVGKLEIPRRVGLLLTALASQD